MPRTKPGKPKPRKLVLGDDAIESCETDWFEFAAPAKELTRQLCEISKSSGICCGIIGSWGSGKSSFMKLMAEHVRKEYHKKACVVWFTAWDPCGMEDLGDAMLYCLFDSVAAENSDLSGAFNELKEGLGIRKGIREHARQVLGVVAKAGVVIPEVGHVADIASGLLKEFEAPRKVQESFDKLVKWLDKKDMTVFFFVDDLDRTAGEQIKDLLSELKVYASKRRVVAVLGYDEDYVLGALKSVLPQGIEPKRYLEKIVTHKTNLPSPESDQLVAYASNLLKSLTALEDDLATELGGAVVRLALQNPRRVKSIVLGYANSLTQKPDYEKHESNRLRSLLVTSVVASIGLLAFDELEEKLMEGDEDEIISAMNRLAEENPPRSKEIKALIHEVETLRPNFALNTPLDLRLTTLPPRLRGLFGEQVQKTYDWRVALSPLISNAAIYGFELPSDIARSSCQITVPASSKITMKPVPRILAKTPRELSFERELVLCTLSWDKAEMIVVMSSFARKRVSRELPVFTREPYIFLQNVFNNCARLVANKGLAVWFIDDNAIFSQETVVEFIKEAQARSKGLKNPLIFQYTPPSKISALLEFLLKIAHK